jgi:hypothetical protein
MKHRYISSGFTARAHTHAPLQHAAMTFVKFEFEFEFELQNEKNKERGEMARVRPFSGVELREAVLLSRTVSVKQMQIQQNSCLLFRCC